MNNFNKYMFRMSRVCPASHSDRVISIDRINRIEKVKDHDRLGVSES